MTLAPGFNHESMPDEVALLLPSTGGSKRLVEAAVRDPAMHRDSILGVFLANPFLNIALEATRLARVGVNWVTNLPSVTQQDEEFSQQLADVDLDFGRELSCLSAFRDQGFKVAAVVANGADARAAAAIRPEALFVLPRVADFAAGFPSFRQRGAAAQAVIEAARAVDWKGPLLGLAEPSEAEHETLWAGAAGRIDLPTDACLTAATAYFDRLGSLRARVSLESASNTTV